MADLHEIEYFAIRYAPNLLSERFVDIGFVAMETGNGGSGFAEVHFTRNWRQVLCMDPQADLEFLEAMERDIRAQFQEIGDRGSFLKRIRESFSGSVHLSSTKAIQVADLAEGVRMISETVLEAPRDARLPGIRISTSPRLKIWNTMRQSFEDEGVWELMLKGISVAPFTGAGDPLKIDFGYRVGGEIKLFHAVSLKRNVEQALSLAYRYPKIAEGIARTESARSMLTAVVDDDFDRGLAQMEFALGELRNYRIAVSAVGEMGVIAQRARLDLGLGST
jgi:hypothetical protein